MNLIRAARTRAWYGLGLYARRLRRQPFPGVAVLAYHGVRDDAVPRDAVPGGALHVSRGRLAEHLRVLREVATPISADQFLAAAAHGAPLPPRPVLVTFDDGYASWVRHAVPELERFEIPAVMFLCPDPIARGVRFWFDAVAACAGAAEVDRLKTLPYDTWREEARRYEMVAGGRDPQAPLSVEDVRRLARLPLVEIGGHSLTHPILAHASPEQQRAEVDGCADRLAEWTGTRPRLFAYPNGRPGVDYTAETVRIVRRAHVEAFAVGDRFAAPGLQAFEQRRFLMLDSVSGPELAHRLAGAWSRQPVPSPQATCVSA